MVVPFVGSSVSRLVAFLTLLPAVAVCGEDTLVSFNGNFLFYNAPVMQAEPEGGLEHVGYVSRWGGVWVSTLDVKGERPSVVKRELVHDYQADIDTERGYADDHAAPALMIDEPRDRLLLATSYHGSDLFLYERPLEPHDGFTRIDRIEGRYTYPRFFAIDDEIYLLARRQSEGKLDGDLVMRSARDGFVSEVVVVESREGEVIYASTPTVEDDEVLIQYSVLSYESGDLEGWKAFSFDPVTGHKAWERDFSAWVPDGCVNNRPTGVGIASGKIILATACFELGHEHVALPDRFYTRENTVRIIELSPTEGKHDQGVRVLHEATALAPYYHTAVAVDSDSGAWLYFDGGNAIASNPALDVEAKACFGGRKAMYPNLTNEAVFFARPLVTAGGYQIRDFHNAIFRCAR